MQIESKSNSIFDKYLVELLTLGLLVILYLPVLIHWYDGWLNKSISIEHEYFSHGLIGLPFAGYIIWLQRKKWQRLENRTHPLGTIFLLLGSVFYLTGANELVNLSLPIILTGLCLWFKGIAGFKLQSFPLLLILLASPNSVPYLLTPYTLPLQQFIATIAGIILTIFGFDVQVEGVYLAVGGRLVEVAPYCAGLKMLFTSLYVSLMLLYWTDNLKHRRLSVYLLASAVAIAVTGNIIRNTILSFFHGTKQDALFTWFHDSWGGDVYSALLLGTIVLWLNTLEKIVLKSEKQALDE
jgi:cyanoexosortase B